MGVDPVTAEGIGKYMEKERGVRKTRIGKVVSDKMEKTVVVEVKRLVAHPLYHKIIRRRARIKAHDPNNSCQVGDKVLLEETRPLSKDKRWRVREVLEKAQ
jgi:small subunit ribosomal protein S17